MDEAGSTRLVAPEVTEAGHYDVLVVGGGLAGLCAALAAARAGARTALVHDRPVLGGNASSEVRVPPYGSVEHNPWTWETGIIGELLTEERARNHERVEYGHANAVWDLVLYEACRAEPNLHLVLNCLVYAVEMAPTAPARIAAVVGVQSGTEKRLRLAADTFIDASGDGALGVPAGVPWRVGQEARSEYGESLAPATGWAWTLGSSLLFRARDTGRPAPFAPPAWAERYPTEDSLQHRDHRRIDGGYWWIEVGFPYDTLAQNEELRDELLRHVLGVWDHIKNHCALPGVRERASTYALDWIGMVPAKRETRRYVGAHVLTQTELVRRELFADRVGFGGWLIDDHTQGGILACDRRPSFDDVTEMRCKVRPYSVPLRSLWSPCIDNLLFAGRLLSASRLAFNSLRVMRTLAVVGQGAGVAAAYCVRHGRGPAALTPADVQAIQQTLLRQDAPLLDLPAADPDDLARLAAVQASSVAPWPDTPAADGLALARAAAQLVPVTGPRLEQAACWLVNRGETPVPVRLSLHPATDAWDLDGLDAPLLAAATTVIPPHHNGWAEFALNATLTPDRLYWLRLEPAAAPAVEAAPPAPLLWHWSATTVPGATASRLHPEGWQFAPGAYQVWRHLAVRLSPPTGPFAPASVTNGVARPERWPNLWLSDPAQAFPQWLELAWATLQHLAAVHLTFDVDTARPYAQRPPFQRAPECVRDLDVAVWRGGQWERVAAIRGNYQRLRVVTFPPVVADRLRLTVTATNGDRSARVFAVRVYGPAASAPARG